jgi:ATP-dependent helicase Lhr and Lhr-like helicase
VPPTGPHDPAGRVLAWFAGHGWAPFPFQRDTWQAYRDGRSGLIHASTGMGKTYAAYFGPVIEALSEAPSAELSPLRVLWITPLRALSQDTANALEKPIAPLELNWDIGLRTGDTSSSARAKQKKRLPTVLVTTPESLALQLTYADARERFANLRCVIVDEWHELLSSKRGILTELGLARLRTWNPKVRLWGLSATLGNTDVAAAALMGDGRDACLIRGREPKTTIIDSLIPETIERFPWAGHLGLSLLPQVIKQIESGRTALVFTNTRSQTESWYQAILQAKPDWAGQIALHHGSLDRKVRDWVEDQLRAGTLRCVVCTSSLDLGVDFSPVDRVIQIGSPKGVARLLQRAGRSGHQPGGISRVTCVPTNAIELIEVAGARMAALAGAIESREPYRQPLDVLSQHCVSIALGGGFRPEELLAEVRSTYSYRDLSDVEWQWVLDFVVRGGDSLRAYPDFHRVTVDDDGVYRVTEKKIAYRHRLAVGTIVAEASMQVRFVRGGSLGTVEESFIAKLKPGDRFTFAGRILELVRVREMAAWVKLTKKAANTIPRWMGGRMPLSTELAAAVRAQFDLARQGRFETPELQAVRPILDLQAAWSHIPGPHEILFERVDSREGFHLFCYPFEGRLVHEGLAALVAYRLSRMRPITLSLAINDYGFELLAPVPLELSVADLRDLLRPEEQSDDILDSLNAAELAKRQFREVARVSGLITTGYPGAKKSAKQLQASSGLFYEVFREHDPDNMLLEQAKREVLERQFEQSRMMTALRRIQSCEFVVMTCPKPTPLAFPLLVDRIRGTLSSETLADRVRRMTGELEKFANRNRGDETPSKAG